MCRRLLSALFAVVLLLGLTLPAAFAQPMGEVTASALQWQQPPSPSPVDTQAAPGAVETAADGEIEPASPAEAIDATPAAAGLATATPSLRHTPPAGALAGGLPAPFLGGLLRPPSWR
jgi:hypothetical protein